MIKQAISYAVCLCLMFTSCLCVQADDEYEHDGYIVKFKNSDECILFSALNSFESDETIVPIGFDGLYKLDNTEDVEKYKNSNLVEYIEPNGIVTLFEDICPFEDPGYPGYQYGAINTNAIAAWNLGVYGNGVKIGVIDSGVYPHNELIANTVSGYNYVDSNTDCTDIFGHGTFCSGIMVSEADGIGIIGISPLSKIVPLKCFNAKNGTIANTALAIKDAVDKFGCSVINMSFGIANEYITMKEAVEYAYNKGAILVAAAGNDGKNEFNYPAAYNEVIAVGSVDANGNKSSFSNYGSYVDIAAPGSNIFSCAISQTGYKYDNGTSFSTPYVSAAAALCKTVNPNLTNEEFKNILFQTCTPFTGANTAQLGHGILNIQEIMDKIMEKRDYYISPVGYYKNFAFNVVTNFSDADMSFADIWSADGKISAAYTTVPAKSNYRSDSANNGSRFIHYIWDSFTTLKPINKSIFEK